MLANTVQQLTVAGTLQGQEYLHTLHFRQLAGAFLDEVSASQALIDAWQASSQVAWLALHTSGYQLVEVKAQRVCGSVPLPAPVVETVGVPGSRASGALGENLPSWMAALSRERTLVSGRSYRGRYFTSGLHEADIIGPVIQSAYLTLLNAYVTSLGSYVINGASTVWRLFVFSRTLAAIPGQQCQNAGADVSWIQPGPYVTTQRSRRSRTGA